MARKARIEYPGAAYHVMSRGNRGSDIFIGDDDRQMFLKTLGEAAERCAWQIHAYVLMGNHYHLLLVTPNGNLVEGMKWLQGTFTQRINARHRWRGHLFQGRYKAQNIDSNSSEGYFLTVANYIHLNPERASMIGEGREWKGLRDYPWSSLPHYLTFKRQRPKWLHAADVLARMQWKDTPRGRRGYADQLETRAREDAQENNGINSEADQSHPTKGRWCLGGDEFRDELMERIEALLKGVDKGNISGADVSETGEHQAEELIVRGMKLLKISNTDLEQAKKSTPKKRTLAWMVRSRTTASTRWISQRLLMGDPSNVSRSVGMVQNTKNKEIRKWKKQLLR